MHCWQPGCTHPLPLQLSAEDWEKLSAARPCTLAQAQRIPGVTPAALLLLLQHVKRRAPRQRAPRGAARQRAAAVAGGSG